MSVEDIAREAGVSRTTFVSYFPSKEAVLFDLDPVEVQRWRDLLDQVPAARGTCDTFAPDLHEWLTRRSPDADRVHAALLLNTAVAAVATAIDAWDPDDPFEDFLQILRDCLRRAGAGLAHPVG